MVHFSHFAVAIFLSFKSLCAVTAELRLSQEQFEGLIDRIPDNGVRAKAKTFYAEKQYEDLGDTMLDYIDEYLNANDQDAEKVGAVMEFLRRKTEEEAFLEANMEVEKILEEERDASKDKIVETSLDNSEESENEPDLFELIDVIPDEEVKEEASNLLREGKFDALEVRLFKYVEEYSAALPDDEREHMESHMSEIKENISEKVASVASHDEHESFKDSEDNEDSENFLVELMNGIPDKDVKEEAFILFGEEKFEELGDLLIEYNKKYIATLPDDKKKSIGDIDRFTSVIRSNINNAVASVAKAEFKDSDNEYVKESEDSPDFEAESQSIDDLSDLEETLAKITNEEEKIAELLARLENEN